MTASSEASSPKIKGANCAACPLKAQAFVPPDDYRPNARFIVIGESPGTREVTMKRGFAGQSGDLLWKVLAALGLRRDDFNVANAVMCAPPPAFEEKQEVLGAAAVCCRGAIHNWVQGIPTEQPLLLLGKTARESFFGPEQPHEDFNTLHGRWADTDDGRWMLSTLHPAYVLRDPEAAVTLFKDISKFVSVTRQWLPQPSYTVVTPETLEATLKTLATYPRLAYDIETEQIDLRNNAILCLGITAGEGITYIFPGKMEGYESVLYGHARDECWKNFWSAASITFVGHNAKFDRRFLFWHLGWKTPCSFDTMLAHYCLDERKGTHGLKALAAQHLDLPDYESALHTYLRSRNDKYSKIPADVLFQYLAYDVICTLLLSYIFEHDLRHEGMLEWPFLKILMPSTDLWLDVEMRGFKVDVAHLEHLEEVFTQEMDALLEQVSEASGGYVTNMNSSAQISHFVYGILGLKLPSGKRAGRIKPGSANKDALAILEGQHPLIAVIQRHRRVSKMLSSYVTNVLEVIDDNDVVHCEAQLHGTETGRISIKDPALQTIPRADDREDGQFGLLIKNAYTAHPGYVLGSCDYSQAELRVAAALSMEPYLLRVYEEDRDLHTEVAISMFGPNWTKTQRGHCKMFNFSYLYGGSEYSFALSAGLDLMIARKFVADYDQLMPRLRAWKDECWLLMRTKGFVQYRTGRKRRIPFINNVNEGDARKASFNSLVQGQASDCTAYASVLAAQRISHLDAHVLLLVHDSIIFQAPPHAIREAATIVRDTMVEVGMQFFPEVKWKADMETGERWGSLKALS